MEGTKCTEAVAGQLVDVLEATEWTFCLKVADSINHDWLVVSTPLKNISQIGNRPQIGVKIKIFELPPPRFECSGLQWPESTGTCGKLPMEDEGHFQNLRIPEP